VLVFPGIFVALGFTLKYAELLKSYPIIEKSFRNQMEWVLFGLSILGVIILWHDFYEEKSHPVQLPLQKNITKRIRRD
jgi:hypothetical protein